MTILDALRIAMSAGSGRRLEDGEADNAEQVTWAHALVGITVLVAVQFGLIIFRGEGLPPELLRDLTIVAFAALAMPFAVFAAAARLSGMQARLPAAFLYLGIVLAVLQILSSAISGFGTGSTGFLIGILGAIQFLAARHFLRLSWPGALVTALAAVTGFLGAGLLIMALPSAAAVA